MASFLAKNMAKDKTWAKKPQNHAPLVVATAIGQKSELAEGLLLVSKYLSKGFRAGRKKL